MRCHGFDSVRCGTGRRMFIHRGDVERSGAGIPGHIVYAGSAVYRSDGRHAFDQAFIASSARR